MVSELKSKQRIARKNLKIKIGNNIRQLRKNKKWSQKDVCIKAKLSTGQLTHYEKYRRLPSIVALYKLSKIFKVSIDYIVTGVENDDSIGVG